MDFTQHKRVIVKKEATGACCCEFVNWCLCQLCGMCPSPQEFDILDEQQNEIYHISEEQYCCSSCCCFCKRGYTVHFKGKDGLEEYTFQHNAMCLPWCACLECCRHRMFGVRHADQAPVGKVVSDSELCCVCRPSFSAETAEDKQMKFRKDLNCCQQLFCCCACCRTTDYDVFYEGADKERRHGLITKKWEMRSKFRSGVSIYAVTFPPEANNLDRILTLATTVLLDEMIEEEGQRPQPMS